jgi:hypothetical protein
MHLKRTLLCVHSSLLNAVAARDSAECCGSSRNETVIIIIIITKPVYQTRIFLTGSMSASDIESVPSSLLQRMGTQKQRVECA